jgi:WD40 repeat protein/Flp pilus assembly protein TadD
MAAPLICPRGHQWDSDAQPPSTAPVCPICGLAPKSAEVSLPTTLDLPPAPVADAPGSPPVQPGATRGDTPSNAVTLPRPAEEKPRRSGPLLTQHVPGYDILGELGRGGMGVVYKARQTNLNRLVALKMILAGAQADPYQLERFRAEAEAVARLHHPHIVQIYEISEHNGCPFFSLEYVDGGTLTDKLKGVPQPPRLAAHLVRLLALAMHSAHQKGIIHRDLKPGNVLLAMPNEHSASPDSLQSEVEAAFRLYGVPKITDFGLAKHLDVQSHTRTGAILGTPSYMAPEQAEGRAHAVGPATDVYGLGAILYEMLTGRPPFESESSLTTIRQLLTQDPIRPALLRLKVPRDLETICLKCLEKDPARRYASAEDLAEDLHRFLKNEPIEARPVGWWGRSVKWMRRHPTKTTVAGVVVLAVATLLLGGLIYHLQMKSAFEKTREYAEETREYAEQSRQNLIRLHVAQGTSAMNAGDGFTALLWFTEALRLDAGTLEQEQTHRQRIAALLQGLPRPAQLWVHDGPVTETRFSPDGSRVLTAGEDGKIHLWDSETGQETIPPLVEGGMVTFALFSRDGHRIAAGSSEGTARVWDAHSGRPVTPLLSLNRRDAGATQPARWLEFSPDGRLLATVGGGEVRLWDVVSGRRLPSLTPNPSPPGGGRGEGVRSTGGINVAVFSPDGRWLATGGDDGTIRLWDVAKRQAGSVITAHEGAVLCLAFSPDSKRIAGGSADHIAQVWNVADGSAVGRRLRHRDPILHVVFSPNGSRLLTSSEDGTAEIWRVADGERLVDPLRHKSVVRWAAFSPDGCRVASAGDDNSARVWNATTGAPLTPPLRGNGSVNRVAFSPDGRHLAVASDDGTARVWDVACRHQARVVDEADVFRRRADQTLRVGELDSKPSTDDGKSRISPDGQFLIKIATDNTARVYRVSTGEGVTPPLVHRGEITYAAFSADGRRVVTTSQDETARVWDAANGAPISPPLRHASGVQFADFSPQGRRLITASDDNSARIWNIESGEMLVPPLKHDGTVTCAVFGPNGRRAATGGLDQTARVWDAETGQALSPPLLHPWSVRRVRFSDDDRHLLTTGPSGIVWSWDLPSTDCPTEDLIRFAQLLTGSRVDEHRGIMPLEPGPLKELWTALQRTRSELFHFSADHLTAWHRQTAEACMRGRHWSAALWHLDCLLQQEPNDWLWHAYRGNVWAELGHWKQAGDDYAEVVRRAPDEAEAWCLYAVLALHQGDRAEYRRACAALWKAQEKSKDPRLAYLAAWTSVLAPDSGVSGERLAALARQAVEHQPRDADYLCTLGAAQYRAGDTREAIRSLNEALALHDRRGNAREWLWLALAYAREKKAVEARKWLDRATTFLHSPEAAEQPWPRRLQLEMLRRQAEPDRKKD